MTHIPAKDETSGAKAKSNHMNKLLENIPEEPYSDEFITELKQHALSLMEKNGEDRMFSVDPIEMLRLIATIEEIKNQVPVTQDGAQEVEAPKEGESTSNVSTVTVQDSEQSTYQDSPVSETVNDAAPVKEPDTSKSETPNPEQSTSIQEVEMLELGESVPIAKEEGSATTRDPDSALAPGVTQDKVLLNSVTSVTSMNQKPQSNQYQVNTSTLPLDTVADDVTEEDTSDPTSSDFSDDDSARIATEPANVDDDLAGV